MNIRYCFGNLFRNYIVYISLFTICIAKGDGSGKFTEPFSEVALLLPKLDAKMSDSTIDALQCAWSDRRPERKQSLEQISWHGPARITEISYGAVRGLLVGDTSAIGAVALFIDGRIAAKAAPGQEFELNASRPLVPNERIEVMVLGRSGHPIQILEWGKAGPALPDEWRANGGSRYPSLFLLGAAKSATTSLHVWLDAHPEIFMSRPKEPFFFEAEYRGGPEFYFRKYFTGWSGQRIVGDSRHRNLYLPFVPERIHRFNPSAKLLVVLRNPVPRAISHWWHWRSRNMEPLALIDALRADLERIESGAGFRSEEEAASYAESIYRDYRSPHRTYLDSGYYAQQLERYVKLFGKDRLYVIFFEDLIANPVTVLGDVFRFLGADPSFASKIDYSALNVSAPGALNHVDQKMQTWLVEHYESHNRALEDLLGRSTGLWRHP